MAGIKLSPSVHAWILRSAKPSEKLFHEDDAIKLADLGLALWHHWEMLAVCGVAGGGRGKGRGGPGGGGVGTQPQPPSLAFWARGPLGLDCP